MKKEKEQKYDPRGAYQTYAIKVQFELKETGAEIIRMVDQYIEEGFMDYEQATFLLQRVMEQGKKRRKA